MNTIYSLEELRTEVNGLLEGIDEDCRVCQYPDCEGFIPVLEGEVDTLLDASLEIVEVNECIYFMNNFDLDSEGNVDLSIRPRSCKQRSRESGLCMIHGMKPIVCAMYPLGFDQTPTNEVVWCLHMSCEFSRRIYEANGFFTLKTNFIDILNRMDVNLYSMLVKTFHEISSIYYFPEGNNEILVIKEV